MIIPDAVLTASGGITFTGLSLADVSGSSVDLSSSDLIMTLTQQNTNLVVNSSVDRLDMNLNDTASFGISINEADTLELADLNSSGAALHLADTDLTIDSGGALTVSNLLNLDSGSGNTLTLRPQGDLTINADITNNLASTVLDLRSVNASLLNPSAVTIDSGGGNISLFATSTGAQLSLATGTVVDAAGGTIIASGDQVFITGLNSSNTANNAIQVLSANAIRDRTGTDISSAGGVVLQANSGIFGGGTELSLDINAAKVTVSNSISGDVILGLNGSTEIVDINVAGNFSASSVLNGSDDISLTAISALTGDLIINADRHLTINPSLAPVGGDINLSSNSGTLTLPASGINTANNVSLTAADIIDSDGGAAARDLTIVANSLFYNATNAAGNSILNTTISSLDASQSTANLIINETDNLLLADSNADGLSALLGNGNLSVSLASGDLSIENTVRASDLTANGVRSGMIDLQVNNGNINLGNSGAALIQSLNSVDENASGGLGTTPTNQVSIRLLQAGAADSSQAFNLGNGSGSDVSIDAQGGDILSSCHKIT